MPETDCTCPYTDPSTWLSAASCGYGSGYEPGSMQEWDPDCPQHPAAPETETDANGLTEAERSWGITRENGATVYAEHDVERIVAERVRVVEGERDDLADRLSALLCDLTGGLMSKTNYPVSVMVQAVEAEFEKYATAELVEATARAESAEAAHEAEETAHERLRAEFSELANEWAEDYPGPNAACNRTPDEWATDLRSILGGGEAR